MTPGPLELAVLAVVVLLLFGWKKLPDAARSVGRSMRIFKSEVKEMKNDDQSAENPSTDPHAGHVVPEPRELTQNPQAPQYPQQGYGVPNPQANLHQPPNPAPGYQQPQGYQTPQGYQQPMPPGYGQPHPGYQQPNPNDPRQQ
ncbi:Sec-independent protein translocase subunit TatA [Corynebacterium pygosceleis]|uniref:Sec-independent protein translocase protein TatA n=1 Tax=Corynebacterium pygosceleis TaxID=2800406 RepID=A0A9Q4C7E7_9CORY|nr:Sec-independent protein translocase subunit TatA [Corynebacterium pygosceleis]MCK7637061.1 Sec-independent protein translocase subunit TatA [Corynebacterium pygosceleis]MCL0120167.1 Sec-independent protein translocase subunit TatA [Corynebacterium pygosceleis]MCX7467814.1 Sec-independent protein translocase subunit TatA [Corynebacterium pygosceleis]